MEPCQVFFVIRRNYASSQILVMDKTRTSTCCQCQKQPGAKTIKKNTNSTQNKSQTHRAKQYEVTSFLSTDCELSTETCSKNVYSLGPRCSYQLLLSSPRPWLFACRSHLWTNRATAEETRYGSHARGISGCTAKPWHRTHLR